MDNRSIVISTTKRKPSPKIGKFSSDDYNLFCDSVVNDINSLVLSVNSLYTQNLNLLERLKSETSFLKKRIADFEADKRLEQYSAARFGTTVRDLIDFHDTQNLSHPSNQPNRLKALINSEFGQATVPARLIENKFFFQSLISGNIVPPADLVVSVSSVFNKYEGDGEIDYEYGGTIEAGDPKNAFKQT